MFCCEALACEVLGPPSDPSGQAARCEEFGKSLGKDPMGLRRYKKTRVSVREGFGNATHAGGHHRDPRQHRLDQHHGQPLGQRWDDHGIAGGKHVSDLAGGPKQVKDAPHAAGCYRGLERLSLRPLTCDQEDRLWTP
ncbi:hypothetical protein D3C87_1512060 [compost metagenome]